MVWLDGWREREESEMVSAAGTWAGDKETGVDQVFRRQMGSGHSGYPPAFDAPKGAGVKEQG